MLSSTKADLDLDAFPRSSSLHVGRVNDLESTRSRSFRAQASILIWKKFINGIPDHLAHDEERNSPLTSAFLLQIIT